MQQSQSKSTKQFYNNPINLYSRENVQEVAKLNQMGLSGDAMVTRQASMTSPTGLINPNKPQQVKLSPSKEYNPRDSATWQALQESDDKVDPEKVRNYSSLKEHNPVFSEVYSAPKPQQFSPSPVPSKLSANQNGPCPQEHSTAIMASRSPVADFLPARLGGGPMKHSGGVESSRKAQQSAVLRTGLSGSNPQSTVSQIDDGIPMYETNSLGEKRRITQSASFNKLMMHILGE